jgi:hypothetical protein
MIVQNRIEAESLVETLNVAPLDDGDQARFLERYAAAGGDLPRKETHSVAAALLSRFLREYVDAWLQTGVRADGSEAPTQRDLRGTGYGVVLEYLEKYPPYFSLTASGELSVTICGLMSFTRGPGHLFDANLAQAKRLFTGLMLGDWKERLCRCRYARCRRYFLLARPRGVRKHGTFCCRKHQALASAGACTKQRRAAAEHKLIECAAKWLQEFQVKTPEWTGNSRLKCRVAKAVSAYIRGNRSLSALRSEVRVNWVTRHQLAIEKRRKIAG